MQSHEVSNYMLMALNEAVLSIGTSRPNPAVGAVVVKDGIVVGKGRTQRPGSAHAEVMALRDAGELARGAAIFVTLEPCCHYGRTPPCTKAIIDAGIAEVYYAHGDPNPVVRGNSRRILEDAGIKVYEGVDACIRAEIPEGWDDSRNDECFCLSDFAACDSADGNLPAKMGPGSMDRGDFMESMASSVLRNASSEANGRYVFRDIERYFEAYDYFVCNKRTFVEVKLAVSQEGFMGVVSKDCSHKPLKITSDGANCWNHELRAMSDAVLVGMGTALADNPSLTVRFANGNDPVKILWAGHRMVTSGEVESVSFFAKTNLVYSCVPQPNLSEGSVEVIVLNAASFAENWRMMLDDLSNRGMHRLMVEPGASLTKQLFSAALPEKSSLLWNRLDLWRSTNSSVENCLFGQIQSGDACEGLVFPGLPQNIVAKESAIVGPDVLTIYYPVV